jgi:hypothetical protein
MEVELATLASLINRITERQPASGSGKGFTQGSDMFANQDNPIPLQGANQYSRRQDKIGGIGHWSVFVIQENFFC